MDFPVESSPLNKPRHQMSNNNGHTNENGHPLIICFRFIRVYDGSGTDRGSREDGAPQDAGTIAPQWVRSGWGTSLARFHMVISHFQLNVGLAGRDRGGDDRLGNDCRVDLFTAAREGDEKRYAARYDPTRGLGYRDFACTTADDKKEKEKKPANQYSHPRRKEKRTNHCGIQERPRLTIAALAVRHIRATGLPKTS